MNSLHHYGSSMLLDYLYHARPRKVMFLGPSDNVLARTIAAISGLKRFNVMQISSGTDDSALITERNMYPNFFRSNQGFFDFNNARAQAIKEFKWTEVGLLYSTEPFYWQLNQMLKRRLILLGVRIVAEEPFMTSAKGAVTSLKRQGAHVIIGTFPAWFSSDIFCEIYCQKMFSPRYVWLMLHGFGVSSTSICTAQQVACARRDSFFFGLEHLYSATTISGKVLATFETDFKTYTNNDTAYLSSAANVYDSVYVIADAIRRAYPTLKTWKKNLDQLVYGDAVVASLLKNMLMSTNLFGLTGRIVFNFNGNRHYPVDIFQYSGIDYSLVGRYDNWYNWHHFTLAKVAWHGGKHYQPMTVENTWRYVTYGLYIAMCVFALLGLIFAVILLVYLIVKRRASIIRNSFWTFNIIIIVGAILLYISVFTFGFDSNLETSVDLGLICILRKYLVCLGFILLVAPLLAKLIFAHHVYMKRQVIFNKRAKIFMFVFVLVLFLITLLILILWHVINPLEKRVKTINMQEEFDCSDENIPFDPFVQKWHYLEICDCENNIIWLLTISIFFVLLLLAALYFALTTRKLFIYPMNDTWNCGICIYVILCFGIYCLLVGFLAADYPDLFFGLIAAGIIICVTAVLIILFLHKVLSICGCVGRPNCCTRCIGVICCGRCSSNDSKSEAEDIEMYNSYFKTQSTGTALNDSGLTLISPVADLSDISLSSFDNNNSDNKKKRCCGGKQGGCCKGCCGNLCFGAPESRKVGKPGDEQKFVVRGDKHVRFQLVPIVKKKSQPVQTMPATPDIVVSQPLSKPKDGDFDKGDGLGSKKRDWTYVKQVLKNNGYLQVESPTAYGYGPGKKAPLKIFNKKPDWSHVVSTLQSKGLISSPRKSIVYLNPDAVQQELKDTKANGATVEEAKTLNIAPDTKVGRRSSTNKANNSITPTTNKSPRSSIAGKNSRRGSNVLVVGAEEPVKKVGRRVVNGPGSHNAPKQPMNSFLRRNTVNVVTTTASAAPRRNTATTITTLRNSGSVF